MIDPAPPVSSTPPITHAHDGIEDERLPAGDLRLLVGHHLGDTDKGRAEPGGHEQADGHFLRRYTRIARAVLVATHGKDPVADGRDVQDIKEQRRKAEPPQDGHVEHVGDELPQHRLGQRARARKIQRSSP